MKEGFYSTPEKPLTSDELNERMYRMLRERARQDAEFKTKSSSGGSAIQFYSVPEKPLSSDEINDRMSQMLRERARQDAEFRSRTELGKK